MASAGGGGQVGGEVQQPGGRVPRDQLRQPRLVDRRLAAQQPLDLLPVAIDAHDVVARLGQASAGDQPHVAGSDNGEFHVLECGSHGRPDLECGTDTMLYCMVVTAV